MGVCDKCGKKIIRPDYFEKHVKSHENALLDQQGKVNEEQSQLPPEPPVISLVGETPVIEPPKKVVLRFSKPIEVYINGVAYLGKEVVAPSLEIATEIVRQAGSGLLVQ